MRHTSCDVDRRGVVTVQVPSPDCLLAEWRSERPISSLDVNDARAMTSRPTRASPTSKTTDIRTTLGIPEMDCPAEMARIRVSLMRVRGIRNIDCDIAMRRLTVVHSAEALTTILRVLSHQDIHPAVPDIPSAESSIARRWRSRVRQLMASLFHPDRAR